MRIVVTGANGMVGRAVIRAVEDHGHEVYSMPRAVLDITNRASVMESIAGVSPDALINCAAYTNVDAAESNAAACDSVNIDGVGYLADACRSNETVFVTISTDYVFSGTHSGFYTQNETPDPKGVYARSKREGELRAVTSNPRSVIVRTGWIFGTGGTNFLSVLPNLLAAGRTVNAIANSWGTPTYASDLAFRLVELAVAGKPGVYHVTNSGRGCSYLEFAEKVCEIGGFDTRLVQAVRHEDIDRPAPRPVNSRLACLLSEKAGFAPMRHWEAALCEFIKKIKLREF